ncbi:hypothetical protein OPV22_025290 [Ensete ventricosum]|uniref:Uncharacterized protein n=1 Tax=Ensete ventricosum TaxID=4639 RepID=A0AAV8Q7H0_ENSVE|nr:hypothetical protein OPV22_025290 [Ensete ventricosum]
MDAKVWVVSTQIFAFGFTLWFPLIVSAMSILNFRFPRATINHIGFLYDCKFPWHAYYLVPSLHGDNSDAILEKTRFNSMTKETDLQLTICCFCRLTSQKMHVDDAATATRCLKSWQCTLLDSEAAVPQKRRRDTFFRILHCKDETK